MTSRLLLDTNIMLDFMVPSRPFSSQAVEIIGRCDEGIDVGVVSAGSLKDVYYVSRKYLGDDLARSFLKLFAEILEVAPLDRAICMTALTLDEPDFEDGVIRATAEDVRVDFIITRDTAAFRRSKVRALDSKTYVELCGGLSGAYELVDI